MQIIFPCPSNYYAYFSQIAQRTCALYHSVQYQFYMSSYHSNYINSPLFRYMSSNLSQKQHDITELLIPCTRQSSLHCSCHLLTKFGHHICLFYRGNLSLLECILPRAPVFVCNAKEICLISINPIIQWFSSYIILKCNFHIKKTAADRNYKIFVRVNN